MHLYLTRPGDTLEGVAMSHRVTPEQLITCNSLPRSPFLLPGHTLIIPSQLALPGDEGYHTCQVRAGDTLRAISERTGVPLTLLSLCNELSEERVTPGEILLIPDTLTRTPAKKKPLGLFSFSPLQLPNGDLCRLTYAGRQDLRIDAAGSVRLPPAAKPVGRGARQLLRCTLDGAPQILPDVAKALLRSEDAKLRILDQLAQSLSPAGADGVIFDWPLMRREDEASYLLLVKEAGRRLRPMGLKVVLYLNSASPLCKRSSLLAEVCRGIDHLFFEASPSGRHTSPPPPLCGTEETRLALQKALEFLPPEQLWLVLRPAAVYAERGRAVQKLTPHQAMQIAYAHGSPLLRDSASDLAWFRCPNREGGHSVWLEDMKSFVRKLEILENLKLQGLALWEVGAYFPEAWQYLCEEYETLNE